VRFTSLINVRCIYPGILRIARYLSRQSSTIVSLDPRGQAGLPARRLAYSFSRDDVARRQSYRSHWFLSGESRFLDLNSGFSVSRFVLILTLLRASPLAIRAESGCDRKKRRVSR